MSAAAAGAETTAPTSPRARTIDQLLSISLFLCILIFGLSMAWFGYLSLFMSPCFVGLTLGFDITLLVRTSKERKPAARPRLPRPGIVAEAPPPPPESAPSSSPAPALPAVCRKPSIICAFLLAAAWIAPFGVLIYFLAEPGRLELDAAGYRRLVPAYIEVVLVPIHVVLLFTLGVLCKKERGRIISAERALRWYQLGSYNKA